MRAADDALLLALDFREAVINKALKTSLAENGEDLAEFLLRKAQAARSALHEAWGVE